MSGGHGELEQSGCLAEPPDIWLEKGVLELKLKSNVSQTFLDIFNHFLAKRFTMVTSTVAATAAQTG